MVVPSNCGSCAGEETGVPSLLLLLLLLLPSTSTAAAVVAAIRAASFTTEKEEGGGGGGGGEGGGKRSPPPFFNTLSASLHALRYFSFTFRWAVLSFPTSSTRTWTSCTILLTTSCCWSALATRLRHTSFVNVLASPKCCRPKDWMEKQISAVALEREGALASWMPAKPSPTWWGGGKEGRREGKGRGGRGSDLT